MNGSYPTFELRNPPLKSVCGKYSKSLPKLDQLQQLSTQFQYRFFREDFQTLKSVDGGPFTVAMALSFQAYLGLDPFDLTEIKLSQKEATHLSESKDFLRLGWVRMMQSLGKSVRLKDRNKLTKKKHVLRAARDIEILLGWQLEHEENPNSEKLSNKAFEDYFLKRGQAAYPYKNYPELLVRWWERNPFTILDTRTPRNRVGATVLLPISQETYELLRAGELAAWDIRPEYIRSQSTYFFLEAGSERPFIHERQWLKTKALVTAFLAQLAIAVPPGEEGNVSGLSFAPCSTAEARLTDNGFVRLPVNLRGTSFPLMEMQSSGIAKAKLAMGIKLSKLVNGWQ